MSPNIILYEFNAPFVIKKDNDNYILYISKKPINYSFIYNSDVSNLLPKKTIENLISTIKLNVLLIFHNIIMLH